MENALSHSLPDQDNAIKIRLSFPDKPGYYGYELQSVAKNRVTESIEEGTGLKYIRSRLEENYQDDWQLTSHAIAKGWVTQIFIKAPTP